MHPYFLPYPKTTEKQNPTPLKTTANPYPHPQPDPDPNNPPSPLNLSPGSSSSSSGSSTIKPTRKKKHVHWKQDYHPSILKLKVVCGDPEDPSLVVVFGLRFREGQRPKVRFSVKRGHGKTRELGNESLGDEEEMEGKGREAGDDGARGRKRKRHGRD